MILKQILVQMLEIGEDSKSQVKSKGSARSDGHLTLHQLVESTCSLGGVVVLMSGSRRHNDHL